MGVLDYLPQAEQIRDATAAGENTATRVGGCMVGIITECNTSFQTLAAVIAALPGAPWDGYTWNQDIEAGDQTITLTSGGTPVASLLIKCATQTASGLMSAADKQKLDALDDSAVAGTMIYQKSGENINLVLLAADGVTTLAVVTLPNASSAHDSESTETGLVTAQQKNWTDLASGCLVVYVAGGITNYINALSISRLYAGQVLKFDIFSADNAPGTQLGIIVKDTNGADIWNVVGAAEPGTSLTIDVDDLLLYVGLSHSMRIGGLQFDTDNDEVMVRCSLMDKTTGGVSGIASLAYSRAANTLSIYGKDANGNNVSVLTVGAASTTQAGVMSASDKVRLNGSLNGSEAVGSLSVYQSASNVVITAYDATIDEDVINTCPISAADNTKAGVMTSTQAQKLAGIEAGAQVNVQADWAESNNSNPAYIANKPTIGTAAALDVPALGNASSTEVVKGNDTRLTNARPASDVSAWAKAPNPPTVTKADVGLGNCDNTSDMNKPVSTAQQQALNGKQDVLSVSTSSAASSIDAVDGTYHVLTATINTFAITLPTMTDATKAHSIGLYFTTGATPAVTITGSNTIKYDSNWQIVANTTHEINALWNGAAWVLTVIHIS